MNSNTFRILVASTVLFAAGPASAEENRIPYRSNVEVNVGESIVIHGMRGECGELPEKPKRKSRPTKLGEMTFGEPGVRNSRSCGGDTPAIEIVFKALRQGNENIKLFGDSIEINVR